ncbi:PEGA domain-containing protein, partial [Luminiphilus sp.]|nr:PEGA domain-containing protein [Luminiphilus sp.]
MSDSPKQPETLSAAKFEPRVDIAVAGKRRFSPLKLLGLLGALAVGYGLFFLLTARSISVEVDAETAPTIDVRGLHLQFGGRLLMRPGHYPLSVTAEGYQDYDGDLHVDGTEVQTRAVRLTPLPGVLIIESDPAQASVSIDGVFVGETPLTVASIASGEATITLEADRFLPYESTFEVTGREVTQRFSASLVPGWSRVTLEAVPSTVMVRVDGVPLEFNANVLEIMQGTRDITLSAAGYVDHIISIDAVANTDLDLGRVELTPAAGLLRLSSVPMGAVVTRDGRFVGATPVDVAMDPSTTHRLKLSRAGYLPATFALALEKGVVTQRQIVLLPALGEVDVQVAPDNATVAVNGEDRGAGNQILSLPSVEQVITIAAPGYASVERRVTPRAGLKQRIKVGLLTIEEAR